MNKVKIKLEPGAMMPVKGEPNAMCWDCYAYKINFRPDGKVEVDLGISLTPPEGYGIELIPRSNLTKYYYCLNNSVGQIDPNYKDTLKAIFTPLPEYNFGSEFFSFMNKKFPYNVYDRVCQIKLVKINDFEFEQVEELPGKDRGGGFGSTGLK